MQAKNKLPLHWREPDASIATSNGHALGVAQFERTVAALAQLIRQQMPEGQHVINLCASRVNFLYALTSVAVAGQVNLLPPNRQPGTIAELAAKYPDTWLLHDGDSGPGSSMASVGFNELLERSRGMAAIPQANTEPAPVKIDAQHLTAVSFTSGSTGVPGANLKTWGMLLQGARVNAANMLIDAPAGLNLLATVPAQHMYGLELSITLPLAANVTVHGGQPLFPLDIVNALKDMPEPRALVTTPQHLRAMLESGLTFPKVAIVYSATAPLDQATAVRAENTFGGCLTEIFGCSEIGSVARRRTATEKNWTPFSSMSFRTEGEQTLVQAPHVPQPVPLQDQIKLHADGTFTLSGRLGDLINIAGKRGSFTQLNRILLEQHGVSDGVIFNPTEPTAGEPQKITRLAALVVSTKPDRALLLKQLRDYIDPVFIPRTVCFCERLPRNENGKLPRRELLALWAELNPQNV